MKNIDKIYLINMKRSTDRLDHFMSEMRKHNLPFEKLHIFSAIDATIHDLTPDELELTKHMKENGEIKPLYATFLVITMCGKISLPIRIKTHLSCKMMCILLTASLKRLIKLLKIYQMMPLW